MSEEKELTPVERIQKERKEKEAEQIEKLLTEINNSQPEIE